ncbi:hypothetical protein WG66_015729 [Moniliophthora roreri]|uniref:Secreted protein n=1 Tax=Moniliophthora roreri TaxID=221103 RepID=A0A0W0FAZ0_MONRR|nr:hypothetical protein WG66_015729 [Moniliophthora roreri]
MISLLIVALFTVPALIYACEEHCMNGTSDEFKRRYSPIFLNFFKQAEKDLGVPNSLQPLWAAWDGAASDCLRETIFHHFRGKCQRNGIEPEGCPNPSCPVRCGTPGSMVYHYPILERLAFIAVHNTYSNLTQPNSHVVQQIRDRVSNSKSKRDIAYMRFQPRAYAHDVPLPFYFMREPFTIRSSADEGLYTRESPGHLEVVLEKLAVGLKQHCGYEEHSTKGLADRCSWKEEMKEFILQYP